MVSSLLNKLANYTNLTQGVVEHEADEDSKRKEVKVFRFLIIYWDKASYKEMHFSTWKESKYVDTLKRSKICNSMFRTEAFAAGLVLIWCSC